MNALIPAFVAVLLAEIGGALAIFGRERRSVAAIAMVLLVSLAALGGWAISDVMIPRARMLMLGLALVFAGFSQFAQRTVTVGRPTLLASAMMIYRSPAPFLAFAFASLMTAPVGSALGSLAGVGVAATIGSIELAISRSVRLSAGAILCLAGIAAALNGLRLV